MTRTHASVLPAAGLAASLVAAATAVRALADDPANPDKDTATVTTVFAVNPDTRAHYRAVGAADFFDNAVPGDGLDGTAKVHVAGAHWWFDAWVKVSAFNLTSASGLAICVEGEHTDGPHVAGEWIPSDIDPNALPANCESKVTPLDYGEQAYLSKTWSKKHPTTGVAHVDRWTIAAGLEPSVVPDGPKVAASIKIDAKHAGNSKPVKRKGAGAGASSESGAYVSFDALGGILSLWIGVPDILDLAGGAGGGVDPAYAGDPLLATPAAATAVALLGYDELDQRWVFGPGELRMGEPEAGFALEGSFEELRLGDTSLSDVVDSYAEFEHVGIQVGPRDDGGPMSPFLVDFGNTNGTGAGMTVLAWRRMQGIGLTIVTPVSLAEATAGFTKSIDLPATILISALERQGGPCAADVDGDEVVGIADLLAVLAGWGAGEPDLDGNGVVGIGDLLLVLSSWGPCEG